MGGGGKMIAIYDQNNKLQILGEMTCSKIFIAELENKDKQNAWFVCLGMVETFGKYQTEPQAQYVLDQIASAIERGDKLYRMPSAEEVEKALLKASRNCENCSHNEEVPAWKCSKCVMLSNCIPKE
jgi:hypothetical protein